MQLQIELYEPCRRRSTSSSRTARSSRFARTTATPTAAAVPGPLPLQPTRQPVCSTSGADGTARATLHDDRQLAPALARRDPRGRALQLEQAQRVHEVHRPAAAHGAAVRAGALELRRADRRCSRGTGWQVRHALDFSTDPDAYRDYIADSRGEFTVAKDQNVRLRTGWFSDRSATYLAAGRPVINQDTGFSNVFPTGEGLFAFSTMDEILARSRRSTPTTSATRAPPRRSRASTSPTTSVLGRLLEDVGGELAAAGAIPCAEPRHRPVPAGSRHHAASRGARHGCREPTVEAIARGPVPSGSVIPRRAAHGEHRRRDPRQPALLAAWPRERARQHRVPGYELIVVDNGSRDGTRGVPAARCAATRACGWC